MALRLRCPKCKAVFKILEEMRGRKIACSQCGQKISVPVASKTAPARTASAAPAISSRKAPPTGRLEKKPRRKKLLSLRRVIGFFLLLVLVAALAIVLKTRFYEPAGSKVKVISIKVDEKKNQPLQTRPAPTATEPSWPTKAPEPPVLPTSVRGSPLAPILVLEKGTPTESNSGKTGFTLLNREIFRQAVLLAGREFFGLNARDAALDDTAPEGLPKDNYLRLNTSVDKRDSRASLERGAGNRRQDFWDESFFSGNMVNSTGLAQRVEAYSRTQLITALQKAGFAYKPNPVKFNVQVPDATEQLISEMTFTSEFAALRELHEILRNQGESPRVLGALVRAYANLGLLTELQAGPLSQIAKARALLYARRLVHLGKSAPWTLWHEAYAQALGGFHGPAIEMFEKAASLAAKQKWTSEPGKTLFEQPDWVELVSAFCRFETDQLEKAAGDPKLWRLGRLLAYLSVESPTMFSQTLKYARAALEENPDCYRIHDALASMGGVASKHHTTLAGYVHFGEVLADRLAKIPGLPPAARRLIDAKAPEADIYRALAEAGRSSKENAEPSWTWLATMMRGERFTQVARRAFFMHNNWGVPVDEFLQEALPLIQDHPYLAYIESIPVHPERDPALARKLLGKLPTDDLTRQEFDIVAAIKAALPEKYKRIRDQVEDNQGHSYHDYWLRLRDAAETSENAEALKSIASFLKDLSPSAPLTKAAMINYLWSGVPAEAAAWEKNCRQPLVLFALGRRYFEDKRFEDAERCFKNCLELSPDLEVSMRLADCYKQRNQIHLWKQTLEASLSEEDTALNRAKVCEMLADYHMARKEWDLALPYAEAAGESWSAWGMSSASACHEGLENWERAELWIRRVSERYPNQSMLWFYWCERTGKGNVVAAHKYAAEYFNSLENRSGFEDWIQRSVYHFMGGEPAKGLEALKQCFAKNPHEGYALHLVVAYDSMGDYKNRDALLRAFPDDLKGSYYTVAQHFIRCLQQGEKAKLDVKAVEAALQTASANLQYDLCYLVGRFLHQRGQKDAARAFLTRAASIPPDKWQKTVSIGAYLAPSFLRAVATDGKRK